MLRQLKNLFWPTLLVSLVVGTMIMFPLWLHHDVRADSPVFPSRAEAERWVSGFEAGEAAECLPWSVDKKVIDEGFNAGWYVRYSCNTQRALVRVAIGYAVPAVVVLVLGFVLAPRRKHGKPARKRK